MPCQTTSYLFRIWDSLAVKSNWNAVSLVGKSSSRSPVRGGSAVASLSLQRPGLAGDTWSYVEQMADIQHLY